MPIIFNLIEDIAASHVWYDPIDFFKDFERLLFMVWAWSCKYVKKFLYINLSHLILEGVAEPFPIFLQMPNFHQKSTSSSAHHSPLLDIGLSNCSLFA
jgi:hypothetical protein